MSLPAQVVAGANNTPAPVRSTYELNHPAKPGTITVRGQPLSRSLELVRRLNDQYPFRNEVDVQFDDRASLGRFCDKDDPYHVVIVEGEPTPGGKWAWQARFPADTPQPETYVIGQLRVVVIVHASNSIKSLDLKALGKTLGPEGNSTTWRDLAASGAAPSPGTPGSIPVTPVTPGTPPHGMAGEEIKLPGAGGIRVYGPLEKDWARRYVQDRCLLTYRDVGHGVRQWRKLPYRDDLLSCEDAKAVIAKVRSDRNGLGFFALGENLSKRDLAGVRVLAVMDKAGDKPVAPDLAPVIQPSYPLAKAVYLYVHPNAPPRAKEFAQFCVRANGAAIADQAGLITAYGEYQYLGQQRVAQVKAGEGVRVSMVGGLGGSRGSGIASGGGGAASGGRGVVGDLVMEYVKAKVCVRMDYVDADSEVAGIGAFVRLGAEAIQMPGQAPDLPVPATEPAATPTTMPATASMSAPATEPAAKTASSSPAPATLPADDQVAPPTITPFVKAGGVELLLLGDQPSARALEVHGDKWNGLGRDKEGKADGTGPVEHMIAGRAVAVVVNPLNKLQSLTLGQVQAIFGGEVNDWSLVSGAGLAAPAPGSTPGRAGEGMIKINCVGLQAGDPVAQVFHQEAVPASRLRLRKACKNSIEALAEVSLDPQAIAFVDLTSISGGGISPLSTSPAPGSVPGSFPGSTTGNFLPGALGSGGGQNVKVLAIQMGVGEKAKLVEPTAENIKNAMYPLSQRLHLYVHPNASDTARDFARFIATCGESEANPYVDTVKAVMETYQKHGLISLADAAQRRIAKDAVEAARTTPGSPTQAEKKKDVARPRVPIQ